MTITDSQVEVRTGKFVDWWTALRPRQWTKNLVVFAGLLFTGRLVSYHDVPAVLAGFAIFCAFSSAGYLVNDALDMRQDREHPVKRHRPIAVGRIRRDTALIAAAVLAVGAMIGAWLLARPFACIALAYLLLSLTYTLFWKHQVILDLLTITAGFVLRAFAGTALLGVVLSPWLFVCVSLLALVLGLGKRRHELLLLHDNGSAHRPVLAEYSQYFLDQALTMAAAAAVVSYAMYSISSTTAIQHPRLVYTVPLVIYGLLRYMYLVFHRDQGGQPEELLLGDRPIMLTVILWAALAGAVMLGVF